MIGPYTKVKLITKIHSSFIIVLDVMEASTSGSRSRRTVLTALAAVFPSLVSLLLQNGVPLGGTFIPRDDLTHGLIGETPLAQFTSDPIRGQIFHYTSVGQWSPWECYMDFLFGVNSESERGKGKYPPSWLHLFQL